MRATLFYAYLSGEHPTLPLAELRAILDVEAGHYGITLTLEQLALFEASTLDPAVIVERAGMVKEAGRVAAICEADPRILNECLADVEWGFLVRGGFAVRTRYIQGYAREALPPDVAVRMVASSVAGATGFPVSLDNPVATVRVLVSEGVVV
ncbi:MAG: hypothetical protein QI199_08990, partial [Candidatus Korarchaeota archaeon]|nr:hypothetical protein [Candidatus Korarchaeota archaeon]